jgi:hypothetical protein
MDTVRDFVSRLTAQLATEHACLADFLLTLAEFDRRRLWVELGHASLFSFLTRELGLSSGAAHYRKTAADLVQRYPEIEAALRSGRLCLSSVIELAKVITPQNRAEVLPRFYGLSARDARAIAVSIHPLQDPPRRLVVTPLRLEALAISPLPAQKAAGTDARTPEGSRASPPGSEASPAPSESPSSEPRAATPLALAMPRDEVEPLTATLRRMHVTVSRRFLEKVDAARAALSHSNPGATFEEILEKGLDLVIERHAKRRGLVTHPRPGRPAKPTTVTAAVKRAVWHRANGRCEWPLESGGVCGSTLRLENAHLTPRARGGPATAENLQLHCRFHNVLAERHDFGDEVVDGFTREGNRGRRVRTAARKRFRGAPG